MNNFGRLPSCKDHFSFRICLLDTINLETIKNWASAPENTEKARKKRSQRRSVPKISPDHLINYIYNLAGGTICAGHSCSQTLWLYTGPSEFDIRTDLQYCTLACLNSRNNITGDLHVDRISIITLCLQETFYLSDSNPYKNPTISGALLFKQLHEATKNLARPSNQNVCPGKKLHETAKIVTWNMQGASNFAIAKNFLDIHNPALLLLQETKCTPDNSSTFFHKLYNKFHSNNDVITLVRKDIKATMLQQPQLAFS